VLFLGYLPPVNTMPTIGSRPCEQPAYPAHVLRCPHCSLVQLGLVVDPAILFPPSYPYTSGTTRVLRENFKELAREVASLYPLSTNDLVIDVGSSRRTQASLRSSAGFRRTSRSSTARPSAASPRKRVTPSWSLRRTCSRTSRTCMK
jgi:hypothetical protein